MAPRFRARRGGASGDDVVSVAWTWLEAHPEVLVGMGAGSLVLLIVGVLALPIVLTRLPADHFVRDPRRDPGGRILRRMLRNLLGGVLLLAGIAMLVLPGQGLLTVFAGLLLLDFPGKRQLTLRIVRRPGVRRWVDRIRHRGGAPPLVLPD